MCILSACRRGPERSGYIRESTLSVGKVQSIKYKKYKVRSSGYIRDSTLVADKNLLQFLHFMPRGSRQTFVTINALWEHFRVSKSLE